MQKKRMKRLTAMGLVVCMAMTGITIPDSMAVNAAESTELMRYVENLNRGAIAMKTTDGVYLSWRFLGTDSKDTVFDIYRDGKRIAEGLSTATCYTDTAGALKSVYEIHAIVNGTTTEITSGITVNADYYFDIPLDKPEDGVTPDGQTYTYASNDGSVGDLDGDGEYEIIIKWLPSNAGDNMPDGYRGNVYYDAYEMDGTRLWRIDMGVNIRAGAHYTPFMVYDYDCDGYAEFVVKTADGTIDGLGNAIGDADADWRNTSGTIMAGPEYLTLFDGFTGEALDTINYEPARGPEGVVDKAYWGDDFGNRSERYLAATAYLDGVHPSVIMTRGYYNNYALVAYDIVDKKLVKRWFFDTATKGNETAFGQGNHNLATSDVDLDGYDEIVFGSAVIDHDGTLLYSNGKIDEDGTFHGYGHGDALHVGDLDPENEGIEIWSCFESTGGAALRDGDTGETLLRVGEGPWDTGRCSAGNFISDEIHPGAEFAYYGSGLMDSKGNPVKDANGNDMNWPFKWTMNSLIYWCGDLERQNLDRTFIECYQHGRHLSAPASYNNGSKSNATLTADLFGDWREEMILPVDENTIRVFSTTIPTVYKIPTLMHDTQYRCQVAEQNVGYNQPPHTSFYLGTGYELPQQPDVEVVEAPFVKTQQELADIAAAEVVEELIAAIGEITYSDNSKVKIEVARNAYTALTENQKLHVTNLNVLEAAEARYAKLKAEKEAEESKRQEALEQQKKEEAQKGTTSVDDTAITISTTNTDKTDVAGSTFAKLKLKAVGKNRSIKLSWSKQTDIDGYLVYGAACGENMTLLADVPASANNYTVKGLKKGKYYKYMLATYKTIYGEKRVTSTTVTVHAVTKGGKYNNPTKMTVKKAKITVKKGKKMKLAPSLKVKGKSKTHISKFRYELSNPSLITINKKGQIKGLAKGSCDVYIYGQNGMYKKVKVVVK